MRLAILLAAVAAACSEGGGPQGGADIGERRSRTTVFSLLSGEGGLEVVEAPAGSRPRIDLAQPVRAHRAGAYPLPSLILEGSTIVRLPIPEGPPGRSLVVDLAPTHDSFAGGAADLRITVGSGERVQETFDLATTVPKRERNWRRHELSLPSEATHLLIEGSAPPTAALAVARLTVEFHAPAPPITRSKEHPNLVLFVVDTLRADRLHTYGHDRPTSPTLDQLAEEGLVCHRAFSAAAWTLPGTASILTGAAPPRTGVGAVGSASLPHGLDTLAEALQRSGVRTAAFCANPLVAPSAAFDQGFDEFVSARWDMARDLGDPWNAWIRNAGEEQFFLYVHVVEPHYPYMPTEESCEELGIAPPVPADQPDLRVLLRQWYETGAGDLETLERLAERQLDLYDAEVLDADRVLSRLLDALRESGHLEETVVCVTSDHGEEFLEHGWAQHDAQLWAESVQVPLVLWGAGVPEARIHEPMENRHLAATLTRLGGHEPPSSWDSWDILDPLGLEALRGGGAFSMQEDGWLADPEEGMLTRMGQSHALRLGPWELLSSPNPIDPLAVGRVQLFHLVRDPERAWDLAAEEPARVRRMQGLVEAWLQRGLEGAPRGLPNMESQQAALEALGYGGESAPAPGTGK